MRADSRDETLRKNGVDACLKDEVQHWINFCRISKVTKFYKKPVKHILAAAGVSNFSEPTTALLGKFYNYGSNDGIQATASI